MQWKLTTQRRNQKVHRETSERLLCLHILDRLWKTVEDSIKNEKETMCYKQRLHLFSTQFRLEASKFKTLIPFKIALFALSEIHLEKNDIQCICLRNCMLPSQTYTLAFIDGLERMCKQEDMNISN